MTQATRRSVRTVSNQSRATYAEPDSDEDFELGSNVVVSRSRSTSTRGRPAKRQRRSGDGRPAQYVEPNTDDEFEALGEPSPRRATVKAMSSKQRRRKSAVVTRPRTRSRANTKQTRMVIGQPRKANGLATVEKRGRVFDGPSDNKIPDWTSVPVNILKDIFVFGAACKDKHLRSPEAFASVSWLLRAATTCRAFALPALEAFYESPVLLNTLQPHELLDLLRQPSDSRSMNHNVKIKNLCIDAEILAHVAPSRPLFNLSTLVAEVPQLHALEVISRKDLPPYRVERPPRWSLPVKDLVTTMTEHNISLKSFGWTRDFVARDEPSDLYNFMTMAHTSKPFERLTRLSVTGFNCDGFAELASEEQRFNEEGTRVVEQVPALAAVIDKLPHLADLTFTSCDVVMEKFLLRLPRTLQRIELTNCLEITSDLLREYFASSGLHLREVVLDHNPSLSFSFLTDTKHLCPRLQFLKMDLTYYSERLVTKDAEALYDELLREGEIPTWPSSLRHLELLHAQKWSSDAAQNLFDSLVNSARELPDLRHLIIHAHINIPWRDRVGFRDSWIRRLRRVFLRPKSEPCSYLGSFKQHRLWQQSRMQSPTATRPGQKHILKSPQVVVPRMKPLAGPNADQTGSVPTTTHNTEPRRSRRVADVQVAQALQAFESESAISDAPSTESDEENDWQKSSPEQHIQGLCDLVDISIDNQRPREMLWTEKDFLDSERSGDEDWNENNGDLDHEGYAW